MNLFWRVMTCLKNEHSLWERTSMTYHCGTYHGLTFLRISGISRIPDQRTYTTQSGEHVWVALTCFFISAVIWAIFKMAAVGGFDSTVRYCLAVTMGGGSLKLIANRSGSAINPEYCEDAGRIIPFQDQRVSLAVWLVAGAEGDSQRQAVCPQRQTI